MGRKIIDDDMSDNGSEDTFALSEVSFDDAPISVSLRRPTVPTMQPPRFMEVP
jgi:hypothetical protein